MGSWALLVLLLLNSGIPWNSGIIIGKYGYYILLAAVGLGVLGHPLDTSQLKELSR